MRNGWIKLHRKLLDNEELRRSPSARWLFIVLLLLVDKNTGQWSGGRFQLAAIAQLKDSNTYKSLFRLKKLKIVTLESNNKYTTICICNWHIYQQDSNTKEGQQSNNKVTTTGHSNKNKRIENREDYYITAKNPLDSGVNDKIVEKPVDKWTDDDTPNIKFEWQYRGLELFKQLGVSEKKKSQCMKIARDVDPNVVQIALSFVSDYPNVQSRWKMFLWKLNQEVTNARTAISRDKPA